MKILFLHDQIPADARPDVADALTQLEFIGGVLARAGHQIDRLAMTANLDEVRARIAAHRPDIIFNLVESIGGEGRLIHLAPALLDTFRIPYTGARTEAMFVTTSKLLTKRWLEANRLPTPAWCTEIGQGRMPDKLPGRFVIKSVWEEASLGLSDDSVVEARSVEELSAEILRRRNDLGGEAFAEAYVDGREFNLALLGRGDGEADVLPPAEIRFIDFAPGRPRIVGYAAKWDESSPDYQNTQRSFEFAAADRALLATLVRISRECWKLFGLRGYARVDFRVDAAGNPYILEINANPCLSPDAGFMAAAARAELSELEVFNRIIAEAV